MQINEDMKLVVPVVTEGSTTRVWAYHTPISREVYEANYRVLAGTRVALASKGPHYVMGVGPRVAALTLRDECRRDAESFGRFNDEGKPDESEMRALFAELRRLTMVLCPGKNGWEMLPVDAAISSGKIDVEDWSETESAIVFFTCNCAMARKAERATIAQATASVLTGSLTSLSPMEFAASLPRSTAAAAVSLAGESSVPS